MPGLDLIRLDLGLLGRPDGGSGLSITGGVTAVPVAAADLCLVTPDWVPLAVDPA